MLKRVVAVGVATAVVLGGVACASGDSKFEKQIESAGMVVKDTHVDKKRRAGSGNKRKVYAYRIDVRFGRCEVTFRERRGSADYTLEKVNGRVPAVRLTTANPTKTDVDQYLASPASPCTP